MSSHEPNNVESSSVESSPTARPKQRLSTETIVIVGLLGAVAIFLELTQIGNIPLPNLSGAATIVHVPAILAGVLGGPAAGLFVGLLWGGASWMTSGVPLFADPLVAVVPRLFVGVMAYLGWRAFKNRNVVFALGFAAWIGTVTNTVLVLTVAILRKYLPIEAVPTIVPQAIGEQVLAIIVVIAVGKAVMKDGRLRSRARGRS